MGPVRECEDTRGEREEEVVGIRVKIQNCGKELIRWLNKVQTKKSEEKRKMGELSV